MRISFSGDSFVNGTGEAILVESKSWRPTLMIGPAPVSGHAETDKRVKVLSMELGKLCVKIGVPYLEVFSDLASNAAWRREAAADDGTHPNTQGYAALARIIGDWPEWHGWFSGK